MLYIFLGMLTRLVKMMKTAAKALAKVIKPKSTEKENEAKSSFEFEFKWKKRNKPINHLKPQ